MSSHRSRTSSPEKVSKYLEAMALEEERNKRPSPSGSEPDIDGETTYRGPIFTGDGRVPLRQRLQAMRLEVQERKQERRRSGIIADALEAITDSPPRTPSPNRAQFPSSARPANPYRVRTPQRDPSPEPECPDAPVKPKQAPNLRRLSAESSSSDCECNEDDHLLDRRANKKEDVASKRLSTDLANRRHQRRITAPNSPSPLRRSFNAEEMAKLSSGLGAMLEKEKKYQK